MIITCICIKKKKGSKQEKSRSPLTTQLLQVCLNVHCIWCILLYLEETPS